MKNNAAVIAGIIVVLVATMIWLAWSFMKDEGALFEQRQKLIATLLLDSLSYETNFSKMLKGLESTMSEYRNYGLELKRASAKNSLERAKINLEIAEEKERFFDEEMAFIRKYVDAMRPKIDSLNAAIDVLPENSDMFLAMRRLIPFHGEKAAVYEEAKNAVKKALKSPTTARFSAYTDDDAIVAAKNDSAFIVSSLVDAQNVYGVPIRSRFVAIVKRNNDKYETTGVSFFKKN